MSDKFKIAFVSVFLTIMVVFGVYKFAGGGKFVPDEFVKARIAGAVIAENIVKISAESLEALEQISQNESRRDYQTAIDTVQRELDRNKKARGEAVKLSNYLDQMAKSLSAIKPRKARALATSAVGEEISIINHLISYNDHLGQLFELLKAKFEGKIQNREDRLKELLLLINQEANSINNLNRKLINKHLAVIMLRNFNEK